MTGLLPCPFCGSDDVESLFDGSLAWGYCNRCSAEGPICDDEPAAIKAWSRRAPQAAPVAASADSEAMAWEAPAGRGIKRFISDRIYRLYSSEVQAFYKPFKCVSCRAAPKAAPVAAITKGTK